MLRRRRRVSRIRPRLSNRVNDLDSFVIHDLVLRQVHKLCLPSFALVPARRVRRGRRSVRRAVQRHGIAHRFAVRVQRVGYLGTLRRGRASVCVLPRLQRIRRGRFLRVRDRGARAHRFPRRRSIAGIGRGLSDRVNDIDSFAIYDLGLRQVHERRRPGFALITACAFRLAIRLAVQRYSVSSRCVIRVQREHYRRTSRGGRAAVGVLPRLGRIGFSRTLLIGDGAAARHRIRRRRRVAGIGTGLSDRVSDLHGCVVHDFVLRQVRERRYPRRGLTIVIDIAVQRHGLITRRSVYVQREHHARAGRRSGAAIRVLPHLGGGGSGRLLRVGDSPVARHRIRRRSGITRPGLSLGDRIYDLLSRAVLNLVLRQVDERRSPPYALIAFGSGRYGICAAVQGHGVAGGRSVRVQREDHARTLRGGRAAVRVHPRLAGVGSGRLLRVGDGLAARHRIRRRSVIARPGRRLSDRVSDLHGFAVHDLGLRQVDELGLPGFALIARGGSSGGHGVIRSAVQRYSQNLAVHLYGRCSFLTHLLIQREHYRRARRCIHAAVSVLPRLQGVRGRGRTVDNRRVHDVGLGIIYNTAAASGNRHAQIVVDGDYDGLLLVIEDVVVHRSRPGFGKARIRLLDLVGVGAGLQMHAAEIEGNRSGPRRRAQVAGCDPGQRGIADRFQLHIVPVTGPLVARQLLRHRQIHNCRIAQPVGEPVVIALVQLFDRAANLALTLRDRGFTVLGCNGDNVPSLVDVALWSVCAKVSVRVSAGIRLVLVVVHLGDLVIGPQGQIGQTKDFILLQRSVDRAALGRVVAIVGKYLFQRRSAAGVGNGTTTVNLSTEPTHVIGETAVFLLLICLIAENVETVISSSCCRISPRRVSLIVPRDPLKQIAVAHVRILGHAQEDLIRESLGFLLSSGHLSSLIVDPLRDVQLSVPLIDGRNAAHGLHVLNDHLTLSVGSEGHIPPLSIDNHRMVYDFLQLVMPVDVFLGNGIIMAFFKNEVVIVPILYHVVAVVAFAGKAHIHRGSIALLDHDARRDGVILRPDVIIFVLIPTENDSLVVVVAIRCRLSLHCLFGIRFPDAQGYLIFFGGSVVIPQHLLIRGRIQVILPILDHVHLGGQQGRGTGPQINRVLRRIGIGSLAVLRYFVNLIVVDSLLPVGGKRVTVFLAAVNIRNDILVLLHCGSLLLGEMAIIQFRDQVVRRLVRPYDEAQLIGRAALERSHAGHIPLDTFTGGFGISVQARRGHGVGLRVIARAHRHGINRAADLSIVGILRVRHLDSRGSSGIVLRTDGEHRSPSVVHTHLIEHVGSLCNRVGKARRINGAVVQQEGGVRRAEGDAVVHFHTAESDEVVDAVDDLLKRLLQLGRIGSVEKVVPRVGRGCVVPVLLIGVIAVRYPILIVRQ